MTDKNKDNPNKTFLNYGRKFSSRRILIISTGGTFISKNTEVGLQPKFDEAELRKNYCQCLMIAKFPLKI